MQINREQSSLIYFRNILHQNTDLIKLNNARP